MSIRTLRTILAPLATAAMMTFGGVAHAGFYGGDFDPLSFSGYAVFNLSPGCETNGFHVQGVGCLFSLAGLYVTLTATNGDTTKLVVNSNPPAGLGSPNASTPDFL